MSLERYWKLREEEERERKHQRKLKEMADEHWERLRSYGGTSPWFILTVILFLALYFIYFAYGAYRAQQTYRPAVKPSATPQGFPPQGNTRRSRSK